MAPLLEVRDLVVDFYTERGVVQAVRGVSFCANRGDALGIVGESGSGKSVTALSILGLIELPGRIVSGDILWEGTSLRTGRGRRLLKRLRGKELAVIFQDPMTSLNPLLSVGTQVAEVLQRHLHMSKKQAQDHALELLELVGIGSPRVMARQYPHQLSGGMCQRVLIAMAVACQPQLLIADEPTTALDVTIQAQIFELLMELRRRLKLTLILITHDLGAVAALCDRILVIYAGRDVEQANAQALFDLPGHPYTTGLLRATPRLDAPIGRLVSIEGAPPDMITPPSGCAFHPRCALAIERCSRETPLMVPHRPGRVLACWRPFAGQPGGTS